MRNTAFGVSFLGMLAFASCDVKVDSATEMEAPKTDTVIVYRDAPEELDTTNLGPNEFAYTENGETFIMKQYYLIFLKAGENRDQDSTSMADIQAAHLAYLDSLYYQDILILNGPTGEADIRGFSVYNVNSLEEAKSLAENDPAVKAGRLAVEAHQWWAAKGGKLK